MTYYEEYCSSVTGSSQLTMPLSVLILGNVDHVAVE
jgi:hypothetical protein